MTDGIWLRFVSGPDIDSLGLTRLEIVDAVEDAVREHGEGRSSFEPRVHLMPDNGGIGHFNVLRGHLNGLGEHGISGVKVVVDDWREAQSGRFGSLRRHVDSGRLSPETLYAELGEIVAGRKPGRENDAERNLFWHRVVVAGCRDRPSDPAQGRGRRRRHDAPVPLTC